MKVRRRKFVFTPDIPRLWANGDAAKTHWANAFSVLLPAYERLFISAVSKRLRDIADPKLREESRIFTGQGQCLYALDARTGKPIAGFGRDGRIDLREGLGRSR